MEAPAVVVVPVVGALTVRVVPVVGPTVLPERLRDSPPPGVPDVAFDPPLPIILHITITTITMVVTILGGVDASVVMVV